MTIVYIICALFVGLMPGGLITGMNNVMFHMMSDASFAPQVTFVGSIYGLIIWDVITALAVWLFAAIYNGTSKK